MAQSMKRDPKHGGEQAESYKMAGGYAYVRRDTNTRRSS